MAGDKYIAFVADMYGGGKTCEWPAEAAPDWMMAVRADRVERRRARQRGDRHPGRESDKRGIGDLDRRQRSASASAAATCWSWRAPAPTSTRWSACTAISQPSMPAKNGDIKAAVFVMHGANDPVVPKADRDALEAEMEASGANWQMLVFGHLLHSFCESESNVPGIGCFDPGAARQCYAMVDDFVSAAFDGKL